VTVTSTHPTAAAPTARELTDAAATAPAVDWLDAQEAEVGTPLVDEAERHRLTQLQAGGTRESRWRSLAAEVDGTVVGYAGAYLPPDAGGQATGDVAVPAAGIVPPSPPGAVSGSPTTDPDPDAHTVLEPATIRSALLRELHHLVVPEYATDLQVWMRHVSDRHLLGIEDDGFVVGRRLGILGCDLDDEVAVPTVGGVTVRSFEPGLDDASVVEVLALAYEGTGDGGWTRERFAERQALPWFRAEDLLLAEDEAAGRIIGLHWLKRRGGGVGEVYNLAIHPEGQGRGLGGLLLASGLEHLREVGCHDVLLWVDRANERAVELYSSRGFTTRWDDVALDAVLPR
jgi:mycothiol synthase